jgi:hypothetical protein
MEEVPDIEEWITKNMGKKKYTILRSILQNRSSMEAINQKPDPTLEEVYEMLGSDLEGVV